MPVQPGNSGGAPVYEGGNVVGVVQLAGNCYGAEPPAPDEQFGRVG